MNNFRDALRPLRTWWEAVIEWQARLGAEKWSELRAWRAEHRWHPRRLRDSAGTRLRKAFGLQAAQVILGHKTLTVTQVYAAKNVEAGEAGYGRGGVAANGFAR